MIGSRASCWRFIYDLAQDCSICKRIGDTAVLHLAIDMGMALAFFPRRFPG